MAEWLKANTFVIITLAVLVGGGIYGYGQLTEKVASLEAREERIEEKIDSISERLARLEGRRSVRYFEELITSEQEDD